MRATPPSVSACVREKEGGGGRPRETKVCETRDDNDERDSDPAWRRCEILERELRSGEWRLKSQTPRVRRVRSARASSAPSSRTQLGGSELAHAARRVGARRAGPSRPGSHGGPTRQPPDACGPRVAGSDLVRDIYCWIVMKQQEQTQLKNLNVRRVSAARDETNLAAPRPYGATPYTNIHDDNRYLKSRRTRARGLRAHGRGGRLRVLRTVWSLDCKRRHTRRARSRTRCASRNESMLCRSCATIEDRPRSAHERAALPASERADEMLDAGPTVERHEDALSFAQVNVEDWLE